MPTKIRKAAGNRSVMTKTTDFDLKKWVKKRGYPDDHKLASRLAKDFQITPHYARAMLQDLKTPSKTIAYIADLLDRIADLETDTQKKAELLADRTIAELEALSEHVEVGADELMKHTRDDT